jgi:hypothetical protein
MAKKKKAAPKKKRAHEEDGTFKADDPATPDINEAFVQKPSLVVGGAIGGPVKDGVRQIGQRRLGGKLITR